MQRARFRPSGVQDAEEGESEIPIAWARRRRLGGFHVESRGDRRSGGALRHATHRGVLAALARAHGAGRGRLCQSPRLRAGACWIRVSRRRGIPCPALGADARRWRGNRARGAQPERASGARAAPVGSRGASRSGARCRRLALWPQCEDRISKSARAGAAIRAGAARGRQRPARRGGLGSRWALAVATSVHRGRAARRRFGQGLRVSGRRRASRCDADLHVRAGLGWPVARAR
jgi:hypothetical protein